MMSLGHKVQSLVTYSRHACAQLIAQPSYHTVRPQTICASSMQSSLLTANMVAFTYYDLCQLTRAAGKGVVEQDVH